MGATSIRGYVSRDKLPVNTTMKTRLLMIFYIDMKRQQGDAVWAREVLQEMSNLYEIEYIGINALRINSAVHSYNIPLVRKGMVLIWNILSLWYGLKSVVHFNPHAIYSDSPPGSLSSAVLSVLTGKPLVVEVHGPAGAQDVALYRARFPLRAAVARWIERIMLGRASLIIAAPGWARLVQIKHGIPDERILVVPLAVNRELFRPLDQVKHRQHLGIPLQIPVAVFVGNIGPWQGLDTLVEAAPLVLSEHPQALFLIVGDGSERLNLIRKVQERHIGHAFLFVGAVPYEKVPQYIAAADVGLALFPGNRGQRGGVSALKTLNYLSCGRPVIVSEMDEMANFVEQQGAGKTIPPDDPKALAQSLSWVFGQPERGAKLRERAVEIGAMLPTWTERTSIIRARLEQILTGPDKCR
jgi:glycosyltransferase involved in cell wall biosynthesis